MTTERQKQAVKFVEDMLNIKFNGDINNYNDVSTFLSKYLNTAKQCYNEEIWLYCDATEDDLY